MLVAFPTQLLHERPSVLCYTYIAYLIDLFIDWFIYWFIDLLIYLLIYLLIDLLQINSANWYTVALGA